jgi:hypothetical protein
MLVKSFLQNAHRNETFDAKSPFSTKVGSTSGHPATGAGSPTNSFTGPAPVRPVPVTGQIDDLQCLLLK